MRRLKRWGLTALLILLGLEILTIAPKKLSSPGDLQVYEKAKKKPDEKPTSEVLSQVMRGAHLVEAQEGRRIWELDTDYAQGLSKDKGSWKLKGVHAKFFSTSGSTYTVVGKEGSVQMETKDMEIFGDVVTTTSEGYVLKTQSLTYGAKDKTLRTPSELAVFGPKKDGVFELNGRGFKASLNDSVMNLENDVRAVKDIGGDRRLSIKSSWCRINGKSGEAHFEENVQVDLEAVRMTGNQGDFVYDKDTHLLKSLLMQGNVKVTDQRHWASSKYAQVLFDKNEFVLFGNPRIIQDENELRGEEIRFMKGGKEVRVSKARARVENSPEVFQFTRGVNAHK